MVRVALPLSARLPGGVKPGQTIDLNVGRGSGDTDKALIWTPTFDRGFHNASRFGAVRLDR